MTSRLEWAFTELYRRRRREVYRFAFAMSRSATQGYELVEGSTPIVSTFGVGTAVPGERVELGIDPE